MKIVALALANVALAQDSPPNSTLPVELHGGAGDHKFSYTTIQGPDVVTVDTSIEDGTMTIVDASLVDGSPQMFYRQEQAHTVGDFDAYQDTRNTLHGMFGSGTYATPDLSELVLKHTLPDRTAGSGAVTTAQIGVESTFLTVAQSATISSLQCTDFLRSDKTGTLTMTLSDDGETTLTVTDADATKSETVGNYVYTLSKLDSDTGDDPVNCGFTYTIQRLAYTLSFCEQTSDVGAECLEPVPGFDKIDIVDVPARTNEYTVNGYSQGEMTAMATGTQVSHSVDAVVPPTVTIVEHKGTSTIIGSMTLKCPATLNVQQDCKFNELCWFKFHVGPCDMDEWTNPGDADINVEPYSLHFHPFLDTMTGGDFVPPHAAGAALGPADHFTALGQDDSYKNQTAMTLELVAANEEVVSVQYDGVTLHGPAMYKADTELDDNAYEIIGYMKFDEATLNSNNTVLQALLKTPAALDFKATSYVRGKFNDLNDQSGSDEVDDEVED